MLVHILALVQVLVLVLSLSLFLLIGQFFSLFKLCLSFSVQVKKERLR